MATRLLSWVRRFLPGHIGLSLLWLSLLLFSVTQPWQKARWGFPLPPLFWMAMMGLVVGWVLSQLRGRTRWRHSLGMLLGAGVVLWQTASTLPQERWVERMGEVLSRAGFWFETAQRGWANNDPLFLVLLLAAMSWLLGYFSPWCALVWKREFWIILVAGVVALVGMFYIPQKPGLFLLFLGSSVILVMYRSLTPRDNPAGLKPSRHFWLLGLAGILVLGTWQLPLAQQWLQGRDLWTRVSPWRGFTYGFERLFPMLSPGWKAPASDSQRPAPGGYVLSFGSQLPFGGAVGYTGAPLFRAWPEQPGYWRGATFEVYTSKGWERGERRSVAMEELLTEGGGGFQRRQEVIQTVELFTASDLFLSIGQPLGVDLPAIAENPAPPVFTVSLEEAEPGEDLPVELHPIAEELRRMVQGGSPSLSRISRALPPDFKGVGAVWEGARMVALQVQRKSLLVADIATLRSPSPLQPLQQYTVTSSVSTASPEELRTSRAELPAWVKERLLALPRTLPERVRKLSQEITQRKDNAYDKAVAIEDYLHQFSYRQDIAPPPTEADGVDHFLFVSRAGYSQYFASAMVVMLRSVGVPARMVAGFVSNEYDMENGAYIVRDEHAHGWVEVFFPDYGWVEFEPTPARPFPTPSELFDLDFLLMGLEEDLRGPEEGQLSYPPSSSPGKLPSAPWRFLLPPLLILVLLLGGYLWWRRWLGKADERAIYDKMCRLASWARLPPHPSLTPLEYGNRLSAALPSRAWAIGLIVHAYGLRVYGKKSSPEEARQQLKDAWLSLRGELLRRALRL